MISALASYASASSSSTGSSSFCVSSMSAMVPRQRHTESLYSSSSRSASPDVGVEQCAPAYTEDAPPQYEYLIASAHQSSTVQAVVPSKLTKLMLGSTRAQKAAESKAHKQAQRMEEAHDAWTAIGVDTRSAMARGEALPPHFFNAPRCSSLLGMEAALQREFGL